eukprot:TRINITY_DN17136_c0_g1_i1.p1 TRINITY_DN17136_c0_g1~~TRINITY_DN17136_c0_g1_i1.p1  ORF type:complete len:739 (-),score=270.97 TRINITY_DN17136_c0_g1_i1:108-2324(-)
MADAQQKEKKKRHHKDAPSESQTFAASSPVEDGSEEVRCRKLQLETFKLHQELVQQLKQGEELSSLESVKVESSDVESLLPEVSSAYAKLQGFARDVNTQIPVPEIVFIGLKGHGKSSLIEAVLGHLFNATGGDGTKRPLFINVINNQNYGIDARILLKRDTCLKEFSRDIEVTVSDLPAHLRTRSKAETEDPIVLQYESKYFINMVLIDTPGIVLDPSDAQFRQVEQVVQKLIQPSHRMIVVVRPSTDATIPVQSDYLVDFVKRVDPDLARTTFVYTRLYEHLQTFQMSKAVNKFLAGSISDAKMFFVSLHSAGIRDAVKDVATFGEKISQSYRRDLLVLEQLQYDKKYLKNIGVPAFTKQLLQQLLRQYQDNVPVVLKLLRQRKVDTAKAKEQLQADRDALDPKRLRSVSSSYVVDFLNVIGRLLAGTAEGNPAVNGQNLEQEKMQCGASGDWLDPSGSPIVVDAGEWLIPYWQNKLYGGQQFERLLAEFKAVSEHTAIADITSDDVASASGIPKLHNLPNYLWAASDLARQKSQDQLLPLIEQLAERAAYVVNRLPKIAEKIMESRKKAAAGPAKRVDFTSIDQYPYLVHFCADLYGKFVDECAKNCKTKCLDEFYSTKTVYWDLAERQQADAPSDVVALAAQLFAQIKDRITRNVLMKFYNFFFVPLTADLCNDVQGKVSALSDKALEDLFEVVAVRDKLDEEEGRLQLIERDCDEKERGFLEAATQFSHPPAN